MEAKLPTGLQSGLHSSPSQQVWGKFWLFFYFARVKTLTMPLSISGLMATGEFNAVMCNLVIN